MHVLHRGDRFNFSDLLEPARLFTRVYFVVLLFGGGIFGLSLINSIFVDNMLSDNTNALDQQVSRLEAKVDELLRRQGGA